MTQNTGRHHVGGRRVAEQEDRKAGVALAFACQNRFQNLPARCRILGSINRDDQAGLFLGHIAKLQRVLIADTADHPKTVLLDFGGQLFHSDAGCPAALEILVDDGDWKGLVEVHECVLPSDKSM